jgi:hypothetical protein
MCLYLNPTYHRLDEEEKPFEAKKNILVYKLLAYDGIGHKTPVRNYPIQFENNKCECITKLGKPRCLLFGSVLYLEVSKGFHARIEEYTKVLSSSYYAIIPKGSHFYIGDDNDIVSDKLIIYKEEPWWFLFKKPISVQNYIEKYIQK